MVVEKFEQNCDTKKKKGYLRLIITRNGIKDRLKHKQKRLYEKTSKTLHLRNTRHASRKPVYTKINLPLKNRKLTIDQ